MLACIIGIRADLSLDLQSEKWGSTTPKFRNFAEIWMAFEVHFAGTMEELQRTMDERLAHSMEELKKILLTSGGNPRHAEEGVTTTI